MEATFWNKLFEYADRVKAMYGINSAQYKTVHEIEDILQEAHDECNRITDVETLERKPTNEFEKYIFREMPELRIYKDQDGYYYSLDTSHFETPAEVLNYIIKDRRNKYKRMNEMYNTAYRKACTHMVSKLYNETKDEFMKDLGYKDGEYKADCSCVMRDTKGKEEE